VVINFACMRTWLQVFTPLRILLCLNGWMEVSGKGVLGQVWFYNKPRSHRPCLISDRPIPCLTYRFSIKSAAQFSSCDSLGPVESLLQANRIVRNTSSYADCAVLYCTTLYFTAILCLHQPAQTISILLCFALFTKHTGNATVSPSICNITSPAPRLWRWPSPPSPPCLAGILLL
jgi:hypothetical protein